MSNMLSQGRPVRIVTQPSMDSSLVKVYYGSLSKDQECVHVQAERTTVALQVRNEAVARLRLGNPDDFELSEIHVTEGQLCKERHLEAEEHPVQTQLLWQRIINAEADKEKGLFSGYRFHIRRKDSDSLVRTPSWAEKHNVADFLTSFLRQSSSNKEYTDLCNLPDLNEQTLLENIKSRFVYGNIYTYVGEILIAVNPFKFFPIYNPTYVKMYQNKRLGELPPHIFAIADAAFHKMLRTKQNQCIVISGESGSGKTESTNLLLHHLTALSQKGHHASGVEQTILGAGPVLEAFGNAKTVHNNNSSRFGKFIQVNYKENGMVHGALVEKYLLEKSRIVAQAKDERNYHVFYYLLAGADKQEVKELHLLSPEKYYYLKQSECYTLEGVDEVHEFARLRESMELVGFSGEAQGRIFCVLSAVLHLGNVEFRKKGDQFYDESVSIKDEETIRVISNLLKVKEKTLVEALTQKKTVAGEETLVMNYKMDEAIATRDAMAKCLYGALFDWIVLKVNHALLAKRHHSEHEGNSIGVLDIFGFEDFLKNSFEQFCINYANEHLQYYFNQHIFKLEQEEYRKEGIEWKNIEFIDNTGCLELFSKKGGLFFQLDEECNFPAGTNESLLHKYHEQHRSSSYYSAPQLREQAFCIEHYAGKVKYTITDFREKNSDLVRLDIVGVLKNSSLVFVRELMGVDPVAVLRWAILRAVFKSLFAFKDSGKALQKRGGPPAKSNRRSLYLTGHDLNDNENSDVTPNNTDDSLINEEALVILSQQPNLTRAECRVIRKASKVLLKNKPLKHKTRQHRNFHDIRTLKSIASRAKFSSGKLTSRRSPPTVSTQFQWSLTRLMEALNKANPFFIRCIKSNAEKGPCIFDDSIVLRQLRYTGMLATVKIRQSGYNYRLTFDEFTQMYKILLPLGDTSSQEDVKAFLEKRDLHQDNYQVGITKVFLREADKILLDEALHNAIMERVVRIQRWMKTLVQRQRFLAIQTAVHHTQRLARGYLVRRHVENMKSAIVSIQCYIRGYIQRKKYKVMVEDRRLAEEEEDQLRKKEATSTSDKGSSAEELDIDRDDSVRKRNDSGSSGIQEDSDIELASLGAESTVPAPFRPTPTSPITLAPISPVATPKSNRAPTPPPSALKPKLAQTYQKQNILPSATEPQAPTCLPPVTPSPKSQPIPKMQTVQVASVVNKPAKSSTAEEDYLVMARNSSNRVADLREGFKAKQDAESPKIHVSPGKKKMVGTVSAPLAKQESIGDLSPEELKPAKARSPKKISLSLTKREAVEAALRSHQKKEEENKANPPTQNIRKKFSDLIRPKAKAKKHQQQPSVENSDDEQITPKRRPQDLGVQVLPTVTSSPLSPRKRDQPHYPPKQSAQRLKVKVKKQNRKQEDLKQANRELRGPPGNWSVSGMSQWQYDVNLVITDIQELQQLDDFLGKKMKELNKDQGKRDTIFDVVFKKALKDFQYNLKSSGSLGIKEGVVHVKYRDLMKQFDNIITSQAKRENTNASFSITMGINAFRGFLDEFLKEVKKKEKRDMKKVEVERKEKNKKEFIEHLNHKFEHVQFNIQTFCESCSLLMWISEKGLVCQYCRYTCHKNCVNKSNVPPCNSCQEKNRGSGVFGAPMSYFSKENNGWTVLEELINMIETQGLYTVGIYRKSGAAQKIKQLRQTMIEDYDSIDFEEYNIHVLTSTLKIIFREMAEPLLTFELFDDFIKAAEVGDEKDKLLGFYTVIEKLPRHNHDLFERLIFHLARVAQHEDSNKMSPNGLAIVFAPCLMRPRVQLQAQVALELVPKQTMCIEHIIKKQLNNLTTTLDEISTLESVTHTAAQRLSVMKAVIRASMRTSKSKEDTAETLSNVIEEDELDDVSATREKVKVLSEHINSLTRQKNTLTSQLPTLELRHVSTSDDDFLSVDDTESTLDSIDDNDDPYEEYAVTFDQPVNPPPLQHLNKGRAMLPNRQPPRRVKSSERCHYYTDVMELEAHFMTKPQNLHNIREESAEILV